MTRDTLSFQEAAPPSLALPIATKEVVRLAQCGPEHRWDSAVQAGIAEARSLITPRARWAALPDDGLDALFAGDTPVEAIARTGERWAFVATIGSGVEARVREHFDVGRYLEGVILDAAGSVAVEAVCDLVENMCAGGGSSARFSPGYCAWNLSSQKRVFHLLHPEEIGVRLLPSMLMLPLKSVSGVVVRGDPADLQVPAEACEQCDEKGCTRRILR